MGKNIIIGLVLIVPIFFSGCVDREEIGQLKTDYLIKYGIEIPRIGGTKSSAPLLGDLSSTYIDKIEKIADGDEFVENYLKCGENYYKFNLKEVKAFEE